MKTLQSLLAITLFLLCRTVTGIEVVADSSCAAACVDNIRSNYSDPNSSRTKHSDLFCVDSHYPGGSEQDSGASDWRYCLTCEASSPAYAPGIHNDTELDVQMFLYNLRLNFAWCVYGFDGNNLGYPHNANEECGSACIPIHLPIIDKIFEWTPDVRYDYCDNFNSSFVNNFQSCRSCLEDTGNFTIMANYLKALDIACEQKPPKGKALDLGGFDIFQMDTKTSSSNLANPSASANPNDNQSSGGNNSSGGTSQKVRIGVGVGVGVGVGGALILLPLAFCLLRRRKQAQAQAQAQGLGSAPDGYNVIPVSDQKPDTIVEAPGHGNEPAELASGMSYERHELAASPLPGK